MTSVCTRIHKYTVNTSFKTKRRRRRRRTRRTATTSTKTSYPEDSNQGDPVKRPRSPGSESRASKSIRVATASSWGAWMMRTTEPQQHSTQPSCPARFRCSPRIQEASTALDRNHSKTVRERSRRFWSGAAQWPHNNMKACPHGGMASYISSRPVDQICNVIR